MPLKVPNKFKQIIIFLNENKRSKVFKEKIRLIKNYLKDKSNYELEIHVADHCNLNCYGCSHYSPLMEKNLLKIDLLENDLKNLIKVKNCFREIRILGGEPLLNPNIIAIIEILRKYFIYQQLTIVTNGILLTSMSESFWGSLKKNNINLKLTLYPGIEKDKLLKFIEVKKINFHLFADRRESNSWKSFKLCENNKNTSNYNICTEKYNWQLRNGKIYFCPTACYSPILNEKFKTKFTLKKSDYILLNNTIKKRHLLFFALKSKRFCKYCILPRPLLAWKLSNNAKEEWVTMN